LSGVSFFFLHLWIALSCEQKKHAMSLIYYNPYSQLGQQLKDGLDAIIAELPPPPPDPTVEQLINEVIGYVGPLYGETGEGDLGPIINLELSILLSATLNGYINSAAGSPVHYDRRQQEYIIQLVEGILTIPVVSVRGRIANIEENIATSGMSSEQQAPLLMAAAVGKASFDYWMAQGEDEMSPWQPYFQALGDFPYITYVVSATMDGALLGAKLMGAKTTKLGRISLEALNAISALSSSLLLAAGKVMLRWQPRVKQSCPTTDVSKPVRALGLPSNIPMPPVMPEGFPAMPAYSSPDEGACGCG